MKRPEDFGRMEVHDDKGVSYPLPLFEARPENMEPRSEKPVRVFQLPLFEET
jgi:hypothetical protein